MDFVMSKVASTVDILFEHCSSLVGSLDIGPILAIAVDGNHVEESPRHGNQQA